MIRALQGTRAGHLCRNTWRGRRSRSPTERPSRRWRALALTCRGH